jgi:hypothetical protein
VGADLKTVRLSVEKAKHSGPAKYPFTPPTLSILQLPDYYFSASMVMANWLCHEHAVHLLSCSAKRSSNAVKENSGTPHEKGKKK